MSAFAFLKGVAVAFAGVVLHELQILLKKRMKWRDANISKFIQLHRDVERLREPGWGGGRCQIRHPLIIITTGIEWATLY